MFEEFAKGQNFSDVFDTYILAYCPDTDTWFPTNQRGFFYEYEAEFSTEKEAATFFHDNANIFYNIEVEMGIGVPSVRSGKIYMEMSNNILSSVLVETQEV